MSAFWLFVGDCNVPVATAVNFAGTSEQRRKGLMGVDALPAGAGLWILPCEAVHTFGMKISLDLVFLDKQRRVLKLVAGLPPRRLAVSLRAHSVVELPAGFVATAGIRIGDTLRFQKANVH